MSKLKKPLAAGASRLRSVKPGKTPVKTSLRSRRPASKPGAARPRVEIAATSSSAASTPRASAHKAAAPRRPSQPMRGPRTKSAASKPDLFALAGHLVRLKGIDMNSLAMAVNMPAENIARAFDGFQDALRESTKKRIVEIAGLDAQGRLSRDMPHFLNVTRKNYADFLKIAHLLSNSKAAGIRFLEHGLITRMRRKTPRSVVVQNDFLRAVITEREGVSTVGAIPDCEWVCGTRRESAVSSHLKQFRFISGDLTNHEFDAIFSKDGAPDWVKVSFIARANKVTIEEVIDFIKRTGDEKEARGNLDEQLHVVSRNHDGGEHRSAAAA